MPSAFKKTASTSFVGAVCVSGASQSQYLGRLLSAGYEECGHRAGILEARALFH
jgi:hypothetical protein